MAGRRWIHSSVDRGTAKHHYTNIHCYSNTLGIDTGRKMVSTYIYNCNVNQHSKVVLWNLSGNSLSGEDLPLWIDYFLICQNAYPPSDSMQTKPVQNDHLSGKTPFSLLQRWLLHSGFTVSLEKPLSHPYPTNIFTCCRVDPPVAIVGIMEFKVATVYTPWPSSECLVAVRGLGTEGASPH